MKKRIILFLSMISMAFLFFLSCSKDDNSLILQEIQSLKKQNDSIILILTSLQKKSDSTLNALKTTNQNVSSISSRIDSVRIQLNLYLTQITNLNTQLTQVNANVTVIKEDLVKLQQKCQELIDLLNRLINQSSTLNIGLLAYYPFTGNAVDSSGNLNNGTVSGATLTKDRFGTDNRAYKFGTNKVIDIKSPSSELNLSGGFSISSWFNLDSMATVSNISVLMSKHNGDLGNDGWTYGIWNPNSNTTSQIIGFQGNNNFNSSTYPSTEGIVKENKWYHFVVTYDNASQVIKYFLNGIQIFSKNLPFSIISNTSDITIGYQKSNSRVYKGYLAGTIDDIRIYSRPLNNQEVTDLYSK